MGKILQLPLTMSAVMLLAVCSHSASSPTVSLVAGTWQARTVCYYNGGELQAFYQQTYRFNRDGTGMWHLDMSRALEHTAFHRAFPFTWSGAGGFVMVNLPSSGADRLNEKDVFGMSGDGRTLYITRRQWQDKRLPGKMTAVVGGLSFVKQL